MRAQWLVKKAHRPLGVYCKLDVVIVCSAVREGTDRQNGKNEETRRKQDAECWR